MTIGVSPTGGRAIGVSHTARSRRSTRPRAPIGAISQASLWISASFRSALPISLSGYHPPLHRGITHPPIGVSHTESRGIAHRPLSRLRRKAALLPQFSRLNLLNDSFLTESLTHGGRMAMTGKQTPRVGAFHQPNASGKTGRQPSAASYREGKSPNGSSDNEPHSQVEGGVPVMSSMRYQEHKRSA